MFVNCLRIIIGALLYHTYQAPPTHRVHSLTSFGESVPLFIASGVGQGVMYVFKPME